MLKMIQVDTIEKFTGESGTSNQMRIGQETFEEDVHFDRIWTGLLMDALKRGDIRVTFSPSNAGKRSVLKIACTS